MTLKNSWQDKPQVKRGDIGERIVSDYLESNGYIIYEPITNKAHPFDKLVANPDKKELFIVEVKTKPGRIKYPDTGIDTRAYNTYKTIINTYGLNILLIFVDDFNGSIYGNWITELDKQFENYPKVEKNIIYWHQKQMIMFKQLSNEECKEIRNYHTGNYYK